MQGSFDFRCCLIKKFLKSPDSVIYLFTIFYALFSSIGHKTVVQFYSRNNAYYSLKMFIFTTKERIYFFIHSHEA